MRILYFSMSGVPSIYFVMSYSLRSLISFLSLLITFPYLDIGALGAIIFALTCVLMFLARLAYLSVLCVSSNVKISGDIHAIITVLQFPPSESLSIRVSLESRYGICTLLIPFCISHSALMQFASASSERLMLAPSMSRNPLF